MAKLRILFAALILDCTCTSVQAQMFNNFAGQMLMSRQSLAPVQSLALSSSPRGVRAPASVEAPARTSYPRDPAVSARVRADFVASLRRHAGGKAAPQWPA